MKTSKHRLLTASAVSLLALLGNGAHAQATTGSLAGWNVFGDAVSQTGAITLTTAEIEDLADRASNLSGAPAVDIGVLEGAAGVAPYALDLSDAEYGNQGSLVSQSFAATAGQTLSFDWSFSTLETMFEDRAFVVIGGQVLTLATRSAPGAATQGFSYTFAQSGTAKLSLGVIDTVDYLGVSSLSVRNLQLSTVAAPIPEPATWALLAGGLGLVGRCGRRRQRAAV